MDVSPAGSVEPRVLFTFNPWRSAILLVAGDKSGNWRGWYPEAIPTHQTLLSERGPTVRAFVEEPEFAAAPLNYPERNYHEIREDEAG